MSPSRWLGSPPIRFAFWAAALFSLVMALDPHPPALPGNPSDKVEHIVAFATLAALGAVAYPRLGLLRLLIALSLFGALIEILQEIPALHRDSEPADWLADTLAVAAILAPVGLFRALRR